MRASVPPQRKPSFAVASGAARARDADDVPDGPADPSPSPEKTPPVASSARSEKPLLETLGFAALTDPALAARRDIPPVPPACTHKRCRMCGNVCNVRVTACTSCCLPLVDRASWDPAELPRPGAASDSSDSSDDSSDDDAEKDDEDDARAPTIPPTSPIPSEVPPSPTPCPSSRRDGGPDPWWLPRLGPNPTRPPSHPPGRDPALLPHLRVLGVPPGAGEATVRAAYRAAVLDAHPDEGGSPTALARVRAAWDAWAEDRWRHDDGAAALRRRVSRTSHPGSNPIGSGSGSGDESGDEDGNRDDGDDDDDVFVSMVVYRHPEGARALRDAFARAARPDRLRFGVVWACVHPEPEPEPEPESGSIDRLHPRVNWFTRALESEAGKIADDAARASFVASSRARHLEEQRAAEAAESASHGVAAAAALEGWSADWTRRVRETRVDARDAEGPCYARHLSFRLWGGETYVACVDSSVEFRDGWDDALVDELRRAERDVAASGAASGAAGAVLTGYPLGYRRRRVPVLDEDDAVVGYVPGVAGEDDERRRRDSNPREDDARDGSCPPPPGDPPRDPSAPRPPEIAAVTLRAFGSLLPRPAAARLAPLPPDAATLPALLPNPEFLFARAAALVRDAPPDPHAPYLHLGEELSLGARLVTRGWSLRLATRCPVRASYDERHRAREHLEDRRAGATLFAAETSDAVFGPPGEARARRRLNLLSARRVAALVRAGDVAAAPTGTWGLGAKMSSKAFADSVGVDFDERRVSSGARRGGLPADLLELTTPRDDARGRREDAEALGADHLAADGLPLRWKGEGIAEDRRRFAFGPPESVW